MLGNPAFIALFRGSKLLVSSMAAFVLRIFALRARGGSQLPGFGTHLPVCDCCPAGLYSGGDLGSWIVLGGNPAADSFQSGLRSCATGLLANCPTVILKRPLSTVAVTRACFGRSPCHCPGQLCYGGVLSLSEAGRIFAALVMINNEALYPWPLASCSTRASTGPIGARCWPS